MTKFAKAFEAGLQHANEAAVNFSEIESIIEEVSDEISKASGDKLKLRIDYGLRENVNEFFSNMSTLRALQGIPDTRRKFNALTVYKDSDGEIYSRKLCELTFADKGYPVKLSYSGRSISCTDRNGFEDAIAEALETPAIGKIMAAVMDH